MLLLWGIPVIAALIGLNRRLFHSYLDFCNLLFAVYIGVWSEAMISKLYSLPETAAAFKPAVSMVAGAFVTFLVLYKVVEQLHPEMRWDFTFPGAVDKLGGGVCGFLAGMVLASFLAFLLCTVPQKQMIAEIVSLPELERAATTSLVSISRAVDRASFQNTAARDRLAPLLELARKADPPTPEEEGAVPMPPAPQADGKAPAEKTAETTDPEETAELATTPAEDAAPATEPTAKPAPKEEEPLTFQQSVVKKAIPRSKFRNGQLVVEPPVPEE